MNINDYKDGNGNVKGTVKLIEDLIDENNAQDGKISTNTTNISNIQSLTKRLSTVNSGAISANSGVSYPGINNVLADRATNVYLVSATLQSSGGHMVTLVSIISTLQYNGYQLRGRTELSRQVYGTDFVTTANSISYDTNYNRFQVAVPNHASDYNFAFSYVKLI